MRNGGRPRYHQIALLPAMQSVANTGALIEPHSRYAQLPLHA